MLSMAVLFNGLLTTAISVDNPVDVSDVVQASSANSRFIKFDFDKLRGDSYDDASKKKRVAAKLVKRNDGHEEVEITNESNFYSITLSIGTPAQSITVLVDTGSSDLWVTGSDNPLCAKNGFDSFTETSTTIDCSEYGTFDVDSSSTYSKNNTNFAISYADGSYASGFWGQDVLTLQDLDVSGLSFAVANYTNSTVGVLGIGLAGLEVTYSGASLVSSTYKAYQYDNFPMVLKNSGAINANAYSLYLNSSDSETGSVLFGGVDHNKYSGTLYTVPLVNTLKSSGFSSPVQFDITLQGLGVTSGSGKATITTTKIPVLLDSGTTLTYLPTAMVKLLTAQLDATYSARLGYYTMNCPSNSDDTTIVFDFGGFHINADLSSFIIQSSGSVCVLGIIPQSDTRAILGDSFLHNAYIVYDLDNLEISLGQAKYDTTSEDIEAISDSVPSAVKAPGYSSTWVSSASITSGGDIFTVSSATTTTAASGSGTGSRSGTRTSSRSSSTSNAGSGSLSPSSTNLSPSRLEISTSGSSNVSDNNYYVSSSTSTGKQNMAGQLAPSPFIILASILYSLFF